MKIADVELDETHQLIGLLIVGGLFANGYNHEWHLTICGKAFFILSVIIPILIFRFRCKEKLISSIFFGALAGSLFALIFSCILVGLTALLVDLHLPPTIPKE